MYSRLLAVYPSEIAERGRGSFMARKLRRTNQARTRCQLRFTDSLHGVEGNSTAGRHSPPKLL